MKNGALFLVLLLSLAARCGPQTTEYLPAFFKQDIGLEDQEIAEIEQGHAVAKILDSPKPSQVFVNGETQEFATCDQYQIQGDLFSKAIRENTVVPIPLEDSVLNMKVIEALFRSAESGTWEKP